jgi:hypothetical protein
MTKRNIFFWLRRVDCFFAPSEKLIGFISADCGNLFMYERLSGRARLTNTSASSNKALTDSALISHCADGCPRAMLRDRPRWSLRAARSAFPPAKPCERARCRSPAMQKINITAVFRMRRPDRPPRTVAANWSRSHAGERGPLALPARSEPRVTPMNTTHC